MVSNLNYDTMINPAGGHILYMIKYEDILYVLYYCVIYHLMKSTVNMILTLNHLFFCTAI
jgi:hypothetical protein